MQTTETTQAQWEAVMGKNPSHFKGVDLPVEEVSWDDGQEFLKELNEKVKDQLKGKAAKLPTEAEWEYACRVVTEDGKGLDLGRKPDLARTIHLTGCLIYGTLLL